MKFSVIIATRNRREDLLITLNEFERQDYQEKEIIVIDNGSNDGTKEMMQSDFPNVIYRWLPINIDILAQNIGIDMASGDLIWRTDSDSYPEKPDDMTKAANFFVQNPDADAVTFDLILPKFGNILVNYYPNKVDKENVPKDGYPYNSFNGAGTVIRKRVFDKIDGFWGFGFEELEFTTRMILAGFKMRYYPLIRVIHFSSPRDREPVGRWIKISSQYMRYNWKFYPYPQVIFNSIIIFFSQIVLGVLHRMPISAIIECKIKMIAAAFTARREEKMVIPLEKIPDITLGNTILKAQITYFRDIIKNYFVKLKKARQAHSSLSHNLDKPSH